MRRGGDKDSAAQDVIRAWWTGRPPRPVWGCASGGWREGAQAIGKVRAPRSPAALERFLGKLRLHPIAKQDCSTQWLLDEFPGLS